tara:strand:+ start:179 stop:1828 length:1650 start_codon:yes stop_codon:yes gene_type:complete
MALQALVPIGYSAIRGILARYGSKQGVFKLMSELGVNRRTASNIMETYRKVRDKGNITQKLGGKDVVSNRNVINVQIGEADQVAILRNIPALTRGGVGQKSNLLGFNALNPTAGSKMYPQGTTQGFLTTIRQGLGTGAEATKRGLLSSAKWAGSPTGIGVGVLGTGAYAASPEGYFDIGQGLRTGNFVTDVSSRPGASTSFPVVNNELTYRENIQKGLKPVSSVPIQTGVDEEGNPTYSTTSGITEESYEDFKKQMQIFNREGTLLDKIGVTSSEVDPRIDPQFEEEARLWKLEQIDTNRFNIAFNAIKDAEEQATRMIEPEFSLEDAQYAFGVAGQADTNQDDPRFGQKSGPNQFELIGGEDRNWLERVFNIGDEGMYVRKIFDPDSKRYVHPKELGYKLGDPEYQVYSDSQLASGTRTVDVPNQNIGEPIYNAKGEVIGTVGEATETTVQPNVSSMRTDPETGQLTKTYTDSSVVGNVPVDATRTAQLFGLANYLGQMANQNNRFAGIDPNFGQGWFNNRTPMQEYRGQRPVGWLDPEFYKHLGFLS